jgi:hypothetical protein
VDNRDAYIFVWIVMLIKTSAFDLCGKYKDALSLETNVCELEVTRGCRYQRDIRIRKLEKDKQHNDQKKKDKRTNNDL